MSLLFCMNTPLPWLGVTDNVVLRSPSSTRTASLFTTAARSSPPTSSALTTATAKARVSRLSSLAPSSLTCASEASIVGSTLRPSSVTTNTSRMSMCIFPAGLQFGRSLSPRTASLTHRGLVTSPIRCVPASLRSLPLKGPAMSL